ncbi:MAG TPA: polyprenyl synthetase family protein [Candidatus Thermoplasmatota archaeon]
MNALSTFDAIARELREVDRTISRAVEADEETLSRITEHLVGSGGKRIRPALVLLSYLAANGRRIRSIVPAAAAVEVIHTATLIHDDISDRSEMRRGRPSAHVSFGVARSLIAADYMMTAAFGLVGQYGIEPIRTINVACMDMAIGEIHDLRQTANAHLTEKEYFEIIDRKTGSLMEAGVRLGVMLAGGSPRDVAKFGAYGRNLGVAFQVVDDTLDISAKAAALGKPAGKDIREGKVTLPVIHAMKELNGKERKELQGIVGALHGVPTAAQVKRALTLVRKSGAEAHCRAVARKYTRRAKRALGGLPPSDSLKELVAFADELAERKV